jgi:hypothetical protein
MRQSWLTQAYTNTIVPVDGSIMDSNAHLDFSGPFVPGTTVIAPGSAVYLQRVCVMAKRLSIRNKKMGRTLCRPPSFRKVDNRSFNGISLLIV